MGLFKRDLVVFPSRKARILPRQQARPEAAGKVQWLYMAVFFGVCRLARSLAALPEIVGQPQALRRRSAEATNGTRFQQGFGPVPVRIRPDYIVRLP